MASIIDNFIDVPGTTLANHVANSGQAWVSDSDSSAFIIGVNDVIYSAPGDLAIINTGSGDGLISVTINLLGGTGGDLGLVLRADAGGSLENTPLWMLAVRQSTSKLELVKFDGTHLTTIASAPLTINVFADNLVTADCTGSVISGYLNGSQLIQVTDSYLSTNTYFGLDGCDIDGNPSNGQFLFKQFMAANSSGGGPTAMGVVVSNPVSYGGVSDLTARFDVNVLCQLVSDTGVRVATSALATNLTLATAMQAASGRLEAACIAKEMYYPADLLSLQGTNSWQFLLDIWGGLVMVWLYERRPDPAAPKPPMMEMSEEALEALFNGTRIFGLLATAKAGHTNTTIDQPHDVYARRGSVTQAEALFGKRSNTRRTQY